jgi:hypothetical protein
LLNIGTEAGVLEGDGMQTNSTIFQSSLSLWKLQDSNDPIVLDYGTIGAASAGPEVTRGFHPTLIAT